ncbi:hypothetical protein DFJ73DRAFT_763831 [Zopfochytrium polystomum]|nr:hypothetical protein DFJ73DRAFT_763831 [Zopfochytrium polystomum]
MDNEESDEVNSSDDSILPGRARKKDYDNRWEQKHTNRLSKVCAALDWSQLPPDKLRVDHIAKHFLKFTRFSTPFLNNKITVKLIFSDLMAEWKVKTSKVQRPSTPSNGHRPTNQGHVWPNATDENRPVLQSPLRPRMGGSSLEKDAGCSASNIFLSAKENLAVIPPQHVYHIINNEEQKLIFVLLYVMSGHTVTHEVEND